MLFSKLEKLGFREKAFLVVGILMLLAVLADRLVLRAVADTLREMKASTETARDNLVYNRTVLKCEQDVDKVYVGVNDKLGHVTTPAADIDVMKGEIDDLARRTGLVLTSMKHREPRKWPFYVEYSVDVGGFEGNMDNMLKFLDAMQKSDLPGLMRVTHLSVSSAGDEGSIKGAMTITKVML